MYPKIFEGVSELKMVDVSMLCFEVGIRTQNEIVYVSMLYSEVILESFSE